jgi:hypothetical protein
MKKKIAILMFGTAMLSMFVSLQTWNGSGGSHLIQFNLLSSSINNPLPPRSINKSTEDKILIWPNPVKNNLYIQTPFSEGSIEIFDATGRLILKKVIRNTINTVAVQKLAKGLYIIQVWHGTNKMTGRFIKE